MSLPLSVFNREFSDAQYNPTLWTPRLATDELLPAHIKYTQTASDHYRNQINAGMSQRQFGQGHYAGEMDVFRPAQLNDDAPMVIYVHGGWWQWFNKEQFSFLAEPFNQHHCAVYMPGYRLAQDWPTHSDASESSIGIAAIIEQMRWAVAELLIEAEQRQSKGVYLLGHSAGGHLISLLRETHWSDYRVSPAQAGYLKAAISLAGLFDLAPLVNSFVNDEIGMSINNAKALSPINLTPNPEAQNCPLHLVVPEHDSPEFFRQAKEYQYKLIKAGHSCHLSIGNNRDHLDIIERLNQPNDDQFQALLNIIHS